MIEALCRLMLIRIVFAETRAAEPYRQLRHGSAHPRDSIDIPPCSQPFTGIFHSFRRAHYFNAFMALVAILCEPLIVALANVPFKPGHVFEGYLVSTWLSVAILLLMLGGLVWKLIRREGSGANFAERPSSIAGILMLICGSHMLMDFGGMAELREQERNRAVHGWGKRYAMGKMIGLDGVERVGVDEDIFFGRRTSSAM